MMREVTIALISGGWNRISPLAAPAAW